MGSNISRVATRRRLPAFVRVELRIAAINASTITAQVVDDDFHCSRVCSASEQIRETLILVWTPTARRRAIRMPGSAVPPFPKIA